MKWIVWNCDAARPLSKRGFSLNRAMRLAGIFEDRLGVHTCLVRVSA